MHKFDRLNYFSSDFFSWALSTVSLHGIISLNFRIKLCVSHSIKHIKPIKLQYYIKKVSIAVPKRKIYQTSENQDLNDFLLETLA